MRQPGKQMKTDVQWQPKGALQNAKSWNEILKKPYFWKQHGSTTQCQTRLIVFNDKDGFSTKSSAQDVFWVEFSGPNLFCTEPGLTHLVEEIQAHIFSAQCLHSGSSRQEAAAAGKQKQAGGKQQVTTNSSSSSRQAAGKQQASSRQAEAGSRQASRQRQQASSSRQAAAGTPGAPFWNFRAQELQTTLQKWS